MNASAVPAARLNKLPYDGRQRRVLIVDDSVYDQELAARLLRQAWPFETGLVIDRETSGVQALRRLRTSEFALVILDWQIPDVDGAEVLRTMRDWKLRTPVIVLSGKSWHEVKHTLGGFGARFLNKNEVNATSLYREVLVSLALAEGLKFGSAVAGDQRVSLAV